MSNEFTTKLDLEDESTETRLDCYDLGVQVGIVMHLSLSWRLAGQSSEFLMTSRYKTQIETFLSQNDVPSRVNWKDDDVIIVRIGDA